VVVSSLAEGMPEQLAGELVAAGVAPLVGIGDALAAVVAAGQVGAAQRSVDAWVAPDPPARCAPETAVLLDEAEAKGVLRAAGVDVPLGIVADAAGTGAAADALGYPVVLKTLSDTVAHKSDVGGVAVGLADRDAVQDATERMRAPTDGPGRHLGDRFLVESMVTEGVVELVVAVRPTEAGQVLTVGAGGVLVELLHDTATVLLPTSRTDLLRALQELRVWPALSGHRGRSVDAGAVLTAVLRIADCARGLGDRLVELEVNPLIATPSRAVAVDALLRVVEPHEREDAP
jgi:acetyl-CoA synthetase